MVMNLTRAQYQRKGHNINIDIDDILQKKPHLQKIYSRPDPSSDRLYQPGVIHPASNKASCVDICGDDPSKLVLRHERTEYDINPAIHYGPIASADQVLKDAMVRDKLAAEMGVLCFEMEAAGLMDQFPCLVIRGICDYSDSHKNKEWQGYAAITAAAYAKDLLCQIPPEKVKAEKRINEALSGKSQSDIAMGRQMLIM
jgi:nucleoside phosphorylase